MPCMEKIYYLSHRTMVAIENSQDDLNDERLFGSLNTDRNLIEEGNIVLGSATAKIEYIVKSILRTCLYIKSILHEIVTM